MNPIFNDSTIEAFFANEPLSLPTWVGDVFKVTEGRDVIPFTFEHIRYLIILGSPIYEAGDEESFLGLSSAWADGFRPKTQSKVIKFLRANATGDHFMPDMWKLTEAIAIFRFCKVLTSAIESYVMACPEVEQFFFWPTTSQLETLYKRTFRNLDSSCLKGQFVPILESLGVFNGYQRP